MPPLDLNAWIVAGLGIVVVGVVVLAVRVGRVSRRGRRGKRTAAAKTVEPGSPEASVVRLHRRRGLGEDDAVLAALGYEPGDDAAQAPDRVDPA